MPTFSYRVSLADPEARITRIAGVKPFLLSQDRAFPYTCGRRLGRQPRKRHLDQTVQVPLFLGSMRETPKRGPFLTLFVALLKGTLPFSPRVPFILTPHLRNMLKTLLRPSGSSLQLFQSPASPSLSSLGPFWGLGFRVYLSRALKWKYDRIPFGAFFRRLRLPVPQIFRMPGLMQQSRSPKSLQ